MLDARRGLLYDRSQVVPQNKCLSTPPLPMWEILVGPAVWTGTATFEALLDHESDLQGKVLVAAIHIQRVQGKEALNVSSATCKLADANDIARTGGRPTGEAKGTEGKSHREDGKGSSSHGSWFVQVQVMRQVSEQS